MNTKVMVAIVIVLVVLAGGFLYINNVNNAQKSQMSVDEKMMGDEDVMMDKGEKAMEKDGMMAGDSRYVEYSKPMLDQAANGRRVLYFYANWCPICRPADVNFKENASKIPEDVTVIRVNYNDTDTDQEEKDLAKKYGITYQHTFVQIDEQGNEVAKWNGGQIDELLGNIK